MFAAMNSSVILRILLVSLVILTANVHGRKHHLVLKNDIRRFFKVSSFGFVLGGKLIIQVQEFSFRPAGKDDRFGFTVTRTMSDSLTPYIEKYERGCSLLDDVANSDDNIGIISFTTDIKKMQLSVSCSPALREIALSDNSRKKRDTNALNASLEGSGPFTNLTNVNRPDLREEPPKKEVSLDSNESSQENFLEDKSSCLYLKHPIKMNEIHPGIYAFEFSLDIARPEHEGLYSVFFHSCQNYDVDNDFWKFTRTNLTVDITERNLESYLSAGEIPLPELYFALSVIFFIFALIWLQVLRTKRRDAFTIHYLMLALIVVKSLALLFHGINYHFISTEGSQIETWAVLFYATHLLKGALLFITIVLIGTGWTFIKHILSEKDKNLFVIIIPLQVLANVAEIITQESEEGAVYHNKWREIFILVDLLCCGAILFPVVWSIRHLQEAANVDGKAATNLKKLKLFRRFYVIVVCYIYFTRIIVYLLRITLPFQFEWMDVFCQHAAILAFFLLTGYHFQPTPQNPYFRVTQDDLEMEEVLFEVSPNSYTENLSKVNRKPKNMTVVDVDDRELLMRREDSFS